MDNKKQEKILREVLRHFGVHNPDIWRLNATLNLVSLSLENKDARRVKREWRFDSFKNTFKRHFF